MFFKFRGIFRVLTHNYDEAFCETVNGSKPLKLIF